MPVHFFEMFAFVFKKMHKLLFTERITSLHNTGFHQDTFDHVSWDSNPAPSAKWSASINSTTM